MKNIEAHTVEADDAFNFIKDLLDENSTLALPDNDPIASRGVRIHYVRACYGRHRDYIARVSGAI